jgi:hypothetical protein
MALSKEWKQEQFNYKNSVEQFILTITERSKEIVVSTEPSPYYVLFTRKTLKNQNILKFILDVMSYDELYKLMVDTLNGLFKDFEKYYDIYVGYEEIMLIKK